MCKDFFDIWNKQKKVVHGKDHVPYFGMGEIWWISLGKNVSTESDGKGKDFLRPVLILQKFYGKSALVIPLTKKKKTGDYYLFFKNIHGGFHTALLPQLKYIDGRRLHHYHSEVSQSTLKKIRERLWELL